MGYSEGQAPPAQPHSLRTSHREHQREGLAHLVTLDLGLGGVILATSLPPSGSGPFLLKG